MTVLVDVEEAERRRRELDRDPAAATSEAGCEYFGTFVGADDVSESGSDGVELSGEVTSTVFQSAVRKYAASFKQRLIGNCPSCRRRKRLPNHAAELFPVPVVTSSSPTAVGCRPRASSSLQSLIGGGRLLLLLLPTWLLPMTSFCLATALPVNSDESRAPVKVFDGSSNNADVDGPVIN